MYEGQTSIIPFSQSSVVTDLSDCEVPLGKLVYAENAVVFNGALQKEFGSRYYFSQGPLSELPNVPTSMGSVVKFCQFYPDTQTQRIIFIDSNGLFWKVQDGGTIVPLPFTSSPDSSQAPITSFSTTGFVTMTKGFVASPPTLSNSYLEPSSNWLFCMNGVNPPQVIYGDNNFVSSIDFPAFDWGGNNQPFGSLISGGQLLAWGNKNKPHTLYASSPSNLSDFETIGFATETEIYPGDGQFIVACFNFKGVLFLLKYPYGIYSYNSTTGAWVKSADRIGGSSPNCVTTYNDDVYIANSQGTVSRLRAANVFGDVIIDDVFSNAQCENFSRDYLQKYDLASRYCMLHPDKKRVYVTFTSAQQNAFSSGLSSEGGTPVADRYAIIDIKNPQAALVSFHEKEQITCIGLIRDNQGVDNPVVAMNDFLMLDSNTYQIGETMNPPPDYLITQGGFIIQTQDGKDIEI